MGKPIVGYWDFRGYAEPIRYLLHYKKVDFEDKRYSFGADDWGNVKYNLGLDFPNLPYYLDGDVKITQSSAILRYVAQKYGLDGKDQKQKLCVSVADQQIVDLRLGLTAFLAGTDYNTKTITEFVKKIPSKLKLWEYFIGDKKYLTGDDITYVDFMAYDTFDFYRLFHADSLEGFPNLKAFHNRIKILPELQEYLSSSTYKKWPTFAPICKFGGKGDPPKHL